MNEKIDLEGMKDLFRLTKDIFKEAGDPASELVKEIDGEMYFPLEGIQQLITPLTKAIIDAEKQKGELAFYEDMRNVLAYIGSSLKQIELTLEAMMTEEQKKNRYVSKSFYYSDKYYSEEKK